MTDQERKAMEMALEALDGLSEPYDVLKAQEALRQALAQGESTSDSATRSADSADSFCKQELHSLMSVAGRMALELECLLLDTKDLSVVSKWWDTGMESLQAYRDYIWSITHGKEEIIALAQPEHEPVAWTKVSDGLPKSGVTVLACYRNSLGNLRRIRAHWIAAKTEESNGDYDEFFEYDEETDTYYAPEGWYECIDNWGDYSSVRVCEGEVTHWMPLPPAPDEQLRSKNT